MFRETSNTLNITKLLILFSFIVCWLSVSTSFKDLLIFSELNSLNFKKLINFLRHILVYICFFFLVLILFIFKKKIEYKKYIIFYFIIGYFVSQIYGLFFTSNSLENFSFIVSAITIILTVILIDSFFSKDEKKYFLIISFIILNIVFFLTFLPLFIKYLNGGSIYGGFLTSEAFLDKTSPRSSGLARMALIILIFIEFFENNYFKKHSKKMFIFKITFLTFIFLFQSRTMIFLTILVYSIIYVNQNKLTFKNCSKFISLFILIPLILFLSLSTFNSYRFSKKAHIKSNSNEEISYVEHLDSYVEHLNTDKLRILRIMSEGDVSSGRFDDWSKKIKKISGKNVIYGFGAQGDRYLINQSASNGLIYAYSSSGLIGVTFLIIFLIMVSFKIIKIFLYYFRNNLNQVLFCLISVSLSLRAILETSYAVFSIDLIVFILALSFIFDNNIKIKDIIIKYSK